MDKRFIKKVRLYDRIATRVISIGGLMIIASVIAILLLIIKVTLPLFQPASAEIIHRVVLPASQPLPLAVGVGDYQEIGFTLDSQGLFTFYTLADGKTLSKIFAVPDKKQPLISVSINKNNIYTLLWNDHSITSHSVDYRLEFDRNGKRTVVPKLTLTHEFPALAYPAVPRRVLVRQGEEQRLTVVALLADNSLWVSHRTITTDLFDNETTESFAFKIDENLPGLITAMTINEQGTALFAGTDAGSLIRWDLSKNESYVRTDNVIAVAGNQAVTALTMVFGDISIAVGDESGGLATWSRVWVGEENRVQKLRKIHSLKSHQAAISAIAPSRRSKSLVSLAANGDLHLDHMTSENHLLALRHNLKIFGIAGRDNSLIGLDPTNKLLVWNIDNPHPEISLKTLFGKVWYESYDQPEYAWQSSSGSDDFEAKFSIIPLLFGTIKGTLYAMIFAIPLAIFGAVYTSQFTTAAFKRGIKPAIEIMASVPSVVIGFLIALWLAPIIERTILGVLLSMIITPLSFLLAMLAIKPFYKTPNLKNRCAGYEFLLLIPFIVAGVSLAMAVAPIVEHYLFAGDFKQWLYDDLGMRYDQRNCIIIAFGLGIAVIPIIFSITEDAITNIPPSLTAASLALGASRWQTIWRVVLPSASPGIFAAVMIAFGRAVGETMIVLMATGNTPILDWSIFNGMRTLSANIAVEIPEAPFGGTLYRVLFLCATMLFALTFILNTGAEIVRERLRKKYGRY
ncbi:MAG TPA: ABC transporter permease subunit [Deltaproteobacteria bacterium]|nr:ABC transporter permease subunit [Deltaproteobacteria bacterium]